MCAWGHVSALVHCLGALEFLETDSLASGILIDCMFTSLTFLLWRTMPHTGGLRRMLIRTGDRLEKVFYFALSNDISLSLQYRSTEDWDGKFMKNWHMK